MSWCRSVFQTFYCLGCAEFRDISMCQISSKSVTLLPRYRGFSIFKMAAGCRGSRCFIVPNFAKIGQSIAEISQFFIFQDGSHPRRAFSGLCAKFGYKSSAVAEMGDRGHNRHGPKTGGLLRPLRRYLGTRLIQSGLGRGLFPYQVASSSIQPFGHNKNGPKIGGSAPFLGRGDGSPSSTMWPRPRPTSMPSAILIHPAVWPQ